MVLLHGSKGKTIFLNLQTIRKENVSCPTTEQHDELGRKDAQEHA